jgi:selenide, water dikinase
LRTKDLDMEHFAEKTVKHLVLIGGGHSHAIALHLFGKHPLPGVVITLISEAEDTPYSGMVPGYIAGYYSYEDCHISLRSLCGFAQARFVCDRAIGLDLDSQQVLCATHAAISYDILSIDIGSTPTLPSDLGEHNIAAKPIHAFLKWWHHLCQTLQPGLKLGIVGGGTGGVELALNMQHRLQGLLPADAFTIHLLQRDRTLMPQHNAWVHHQFHQLLERRGIQIHLREAVQATQAGQLLCQSGLTIACDETVWVTQASAPAWIGQSGLQVDSTGFIVVDDTLRSLSHPTVFATGDIATIANFPRPKAGVFAVRQGKPLFQNLRAVLTAPDRRRTLKPYHPQARYLSLIGTGDGSAVASYGAIGWRSHWLWHWKDRIDRRFMAQFSAYD